MKIAYVVSQYPAPSHTFIRREIDALRARGAEISIFSVRQPAEAEILSDKDADSQRETYYIFPPKPLKALETFGRYLFDRPARMARALWATQTIRNGGVREMVYGAIYFAEGVLFAKEMEKSGVGHLHCHFSNAASQAALAASIIADIPFSLTLHGLGDFEHPGAPLLGRKLEHAAFIVCAHEYGMAQSMRLSERAQWGKLGVVRCGIETAKLPERQPRPTGSRFRYICVGRLSPEKGQIGLLRGFAEARRRGMDAELILVGDGPDRDVVEAEVQTLGLSADVQMLGRLSEADTLAEVARADAMVMASFMEGLPVSLMEALGIGIPVIAPCITGIPELVQPQKTGLLFTAGNWSELADRLIEMHGDEEGRARMARAGREKVLADFDITEAVVPLERWFREPPAPVKAPARGVGARLRRLLGS